MLSELVPPRMFTVTEALLTIAYEVPETGLAGNVIVCEAVEPLKTVTSPRIAVAVAERRVRSMLDTGFHVPGVPAIVQIQSVAVMSHIMSPTANVPEVGAPDVVLEPTQRYPPVAPVRPEATKSGEVTAPVNVAPVKAASCSMRFASTVCAML